MGIVTAITDVFEAIGSWIITFLNSLIPLFWQAPTTESGTGNLTFFGILAVIGLAISVFFLLMRVVENFIHLRS